MQFTGLPAAPMQQTYSHHHQQQQQHGHSEIHANTWMPGQAQYSTQQQHLVAQQHYQQPAPLQHSYQQPAVQQPAAQQHQWQQPSPSSYTPPLLSHSSGSQPQPVMVVVQLPGHQQHQQQMPPAPPQYGAVLAPPAQPYSSSHSWPVHSRSYPATQQGLQRVGEFDRPGGQYGGHWGSQYQAPAPAPVHAPPPPSRHAMPPRPMLRQQQWQQQHSRPQQDWQQYRQQHWEQHAYYLRSSERPEWEQRELTRVPVAAPKSKQQPERSGKQQQQHQQQAAAAQQPTAAAFNLQDRIPCLQAADVSKQQAQQSNKLLQKAYPRIEKRQQDEQPQQTQKNKKQKKQNQQQQQQQQQQVAVVPRPPPVRHHTEFNSQAAIMQLPLEALEAIACKLQLQERLKFARLVLPPDSAAAAAALGTVHHLRMEKFHCASVTAWLFQLPQLQQLQLKLNLNKGSAPAAPELASLSKLSGLTSLNIAVLVGGISGKKGKRNERMQRQQSIVRSIGGLVHLQQLTFTTCGAAAACGSQAWSGLTALTALQHLSLQCQFCPHAVGLQQLQSLTQLTELSLVETHPDESYEPVRGHFFAAQALPAAPQQAGVAQMLLQLGRPKDSCAAPPVWPALQLQRLRLQSSFRSEGRMLLLPEQLRVLDVSGCRTLSLNSRFAMQLSRLTALQELHASKCIDLVPHMLSYQEGFLSGLTSLTQLDMSFCGKLPPWGDGVAQALGKLSSLVQLQLQNTSCGNTAMAAIRAVSGLTQLTRLSIGCHKLKPRRRLPAQQLQPLTALAGLQDLEVYGVSLVTAEDRECMKKFTALTSLTLHDCEPDPRESPSTDFLEWEREFESDMKGALSGLKSVEVKCNDAEIDDVEYSSGDLADSYEMHGGYGDSGSEGFDSDDDGWRDPEFSEGGGWYPDGPYGEVFYAAER